VLVAAFLPHPPALVPGLTGGPVAELEPLRRATAAALEWLLSVAPQRICLLGGGPVERVFDGTARGTMGGYGVPVSVGSGGGDRLPLSLTVGWGLLDAAGYAGDRVAVALPSNVTDGRLDELARTVDGDALLVMGDGSARRDHDAPGLQHSEGRRYDHAVAAALASGDAGALAGLDPGLEQAVQAAGVPAWRLAGRVFGGRPVHAVLAEHTAPFGVGYFVATWSAR